MKSCEPQTFCALFFSKSVIYAAKVRCLWKKKCSHCIIMRTWTDCHTITSPHFSGETVKLVLKERNQFTTFTTTSPTAGPQVGTGGQRSSWLIYSASSSSFTSPNAFIHFLCQHLQDIMQLCADHFKVVHYKAGCFFFFHPTDHCQVSFYSYVGRSNFQEQTKEADAQPYLPRYGFTRGGKTWNEAPLCPPNLRPPPLEGTGCRIIAHNHLFTPTAV